MKSWVKLYTEINRDPKMAQFTWAQRGIWTALLALAGELDIRNGDDSENGELDTVENTAWRIRCDLAELSEAVTVFAQCGMIETVDGVLTMTNYPKRQARPPSASREAVKKRVANHRERVRNEPVTSVQREVTPLDSDVDSDTDSEAEEIAAATPPAKPPKRRGKRKTDPRTQHPAIQAVREVTNRYPPKPIWDDIIKLLEDEPRVEEMRLCFKEWVKPGYNPLNFAWLFDWYVSGIPARRPTRGSVQENTADVIKRYRERHSGES